MPRRLTVLLIAVPVITALAAGCERKAAKTIEPGAEAVPKIVATPNPAPYSNNSTANTGFFNYLLLLVN